MQDISRTLNAQNSDEKFDKEEQKLKEDRYFMSIALKLAEKNLGNVAPNPSVGCVVVHDGMVIAKGQTKVGGRPHAETVALRNAKCSTDGATMYVTLEPCCHYGVTGPCTSEIIKAKIKRVVVATVDPDNRVSGNGIKILTNAGIQVEQGVMKNEAEKLNVGFFFTKIFKRPFIACKIATTLDGKIATFTGDSKWITSEETRKWVHELRAKYDAIMIGSNTLVNDDPMLTCRLPGIEEKSPIRIIIDTQGRLQAEHKIAKTACQVKTWIVTNNEVPEEKKIKNINYLIANPNDEGKVCFLDLVSRLCSQIYLTRVLVEGGGTIVTELLKLNLIDRLIICQSGKIVGNDGIPFAGNLGVRIMNECYKFTKSEVLNFEEDIVVVWDRLA